jgi:Holliday junction DNA helicase RuvB
MARETVISGTGGEPDERDSSLRPQRMEEMVGQRDVYERLKIALDAALKRGESIGHILFDGPPGLGKTTFATCLPRELGVGIQMASGPTLKAPNVLLPYLTNLEPNSILFIDEIHRIPSAVEEYLYTAMEDFRIDFVLGEGVSARTINMNLKPFTLIGATTRAGMLTGPLRDRFVIRETLSFYTVEELTEIVRRSADRLKVVIENNAAIELAGRSRGTPRHANNHLRRVRDFATVRHDGTITLEVTKAALKMYGVDEIGLLKNDRDYLKTIINAFGGGPAGIEAIAHTMNTSADTLTDEVEPFLLRSEYVVRTSRGRIATTKAYQHLGLAAPSTSGQKELF